MPEDSFAREDIRKLEKRIKDECIFLENKIKLLEEYLELRYDDTARYVRKNKLNISQ